MVNSRAVQWHGREMLTSPHAVQVLGIPRVDVMHFGGVDGQ